jgi:hypothetical protein
VLAPAFGEIDREVAAGIGALNPVGPTAFGDTCRSYSASS